MNDGEKIISEKIPMEDQGKKDKTRTGRNWGAEGLRNFAFKKYWTESPTTNHKNLYLNETLKINNNYLI